MRILQNMVFFILKLICTRRKKQLNKITTTSEETTENSLFATTTKHSWFYKFLYGSNHHQIWCDKQEFLSEVLLLNYSFKLPFLYLLFSLQYFNKHISQPSLDVCHLGYSFVGFGQNHSFWLAYSMVFISYMSDLVIIREFWTKPCILACIHFSLH